MKINEVIERECCQYHDMKTLGGIDRKPKDDYRFCIYCGRHWRYYLKLGDEDENIHPEPWPWENLKEFRQPGGLGVYSG